MSEKSLQPALNDLDAVVGNVLKKSPYLSGRSLRFEASDGRVVLRGTVGSYYQKQMAQEALRSVEGIGTIENQLEVEWGD